MKKKLTTLLIWVALVSVFVLVFINRGNRGPSRTENPQTFRRHVESGEVSTVQFNDDGTLTVTLHAWPDDPYTTRATALDQELTRILSEQHAFIPRTQKSKFPVTALWIGIGLILFLVFFLYFLKKMGGGTANILALSKSRARLISEERTVTFSEVGGCIAAKEQLGDVIDFLKHPKRWTDAGARVPRGILLEGPPGCGKTLLARAVAGETDARFYLVSASEFVEMFVGVGAARVRDMFEKAAKQAPAVIFIDELDAVGRKRGSGIGAGHDEREQTLNQLLVSLDGFETNDRVVVIAATNRPDILDKALLRSGRFDRRIKIPELTAEERVEILTIHTQNKHLDDDVSLRQLAGKTDGFNGSQLESLANEAALLAVRRTRRTNEETTVIRSDDFLKALEPDDSRPTLFSKLDSVLIESTSQLAEPTGRAVVRLTLREQTVVEGEVVWVNASLIKVKTEDGSETIVPKHQIEKIEALKGTETTDREDVVPDLWANRQPDLA